MSRRKRILLSLLTVLLLLALPGFYNPLVVRRYHIEVPGIISPIRVALVTDLHSCFYGEGQRELIDAIDAENPDLILLGGDIFDDDLPDDNTETFLKGISGRFPVYYVTGNHEYLSGENSFIQKMAILKKYGVKRLCGETTAVDVKGERICLGGVDDPQAWIESNNFTEHIDGSFNDQLAKVAEQAEDEVYSILLSHRPEMLDTYSQYSFDLVLAGHAHGGQWRIPGLLNGVFAPNQGLFPRYAGGLYHQKNTVMIVSRGLARESTRIPRWYNCPELVMVELKPISTE